MDMYSILGFLLAVSIFESVPKVLGSDTLPGKVNNLKTTLVTSSAIGLSWTASTSNISFTNYIVFILQEGQCSQADFIRCSYSTVVSDAHCPYINAGASASYDACHGDMSYNVTSRLTSYTDYVVVVAAAHDATVGENSTLTVKTHIGIPAPASNIRLTAQNQSALLVEWDIPLHNAGPMWYTVTVLDAIDRTSSTFIAKRDYNVEGWKSSSCEVVDLLSDWRYMVSITSSTSAGTSDRATSKAVRTLPSTPGAVQNIVVQFVSSQYLAARLIWECPPEKMRNGRITSYTITYTGNVSMTVTAGSYYPEDPCTALHMVYLPVIPDGHYIVKIWPNAEIKGIEATMKFVADRKNLYYRIPSNSTTTVPLTDTKPIIIVSATLGSIIAILFVAVTALILTR